MNTKESKWWIKLYDDNIEYISIHIKPYQDGMSVLVILIKIGPTIGSKRTSKQKLTVFSRYLFLQKSYIIHVWQGLKYTSGYLQVLRSKRIWALETWDQTSEQRITKLGLGISIEK